MASDIELPNPPKMCPEFHEKRAEWVRSLGYLDDTAQDTDPNGVSQSLHAIIHDSMVYRLVNHSRSIAAVDIDGHSSCNGMLHSFIDRCYANSQIIQIRRLADPGPLGGKKAVYTLRGVCEDMKQHCHLLVRQNIFAAHGLVLDESTIAESQMQLIASGSDPGLPVSCNLPNIRSLNKHVDHWAGVTPDTRDSADCVRPDFLLQLSEQISTASTVFKNHADKWIAHAATLESRDQVKEENMAITWDQLFKVSHVFVRVVVALEQLLGISRGIRYIDRCGSALRGIDQPLVSTDDLPRLQEFWRELLREANDAWKPGKLG